ncbi:MAG TPA: DUF1697 domain-containing protein [Gaiellaceae bacterium]|nr:DUF1697 domain-containing protein [Gaiellaceae bacterium]
MSRYVVLLRGINIGSRNRIAMPALREALGEAGFEDVQTYVQSGNVVLTSRAKTDAVRRKVEQMITERFDLEIDVLVRTRADLARIAKANPLRQVAANPKRYQVTFLESKLPAETVRELEELAAHGEQVVARGKEVYAWTPDGIARSKLWAKLAGKSLGVTATSRNWTTVEALRDLAGG